MAFEQDISLKERKDSQRDVIYSHLQKACDIYGIQPAHLEIENPGELLQATADRFLFYDLDEKFFLDPENTLVALAFTQELLFAGGDEVKQFRAIRGFELFTGTNFPIRFSLSEYVRQAYSPQFSPLTSETAVRRAAVKNLILEIEQAQYQPIQEGMTVNGIDIWEVAKTAADRLSLTHKLDFHELDVAILDPDIFSSLNIHALALGKKIAISPTCSRNVLMHECVHALAGLDFAKGFKNFFLRGVMEAITEAMTEKPALYEKQRKVLEAIYTQVPDHRQFARELGNAYREKAIRGVEGSRKEMWKMLIQTYGLKSVVYFGLLDPEYSTFIENLMGADNAKVFIPAEEAQDFFAHPHKRGN